MDRREFLKAAAALPVVAAVPALAAPVTVGVDLCARDDEVWLIFEQPFSGGGGEAEAIYAQWDAEARRVAGSAGKVVRWSRLQHLAGECCYSDPLGQFGHLRAEYALSGY